MPILLTLALCSAAPHVESGTVVSCDAWLEVRTDDGAAYVLVVDATRVVWHLDRRVPLPRCELRPGRRVRFLRDEHAARALWVEVVSFAPLAMEAAVEEWVCEVVGGRAWRGLGGEDAALVEQLGADNWTLRRAATERLRERGAGALRPLIFARHSSDLEVRVRAEGLLRRLGWQP